MESEEGHDAAAEGAEREEVLGERYDGRLEGAVTAGYIE